MVVYANDGLIKLESEVNPGTYTFTYVISSKANPKDSDTANVTITVRGVYNGKEVRELTRNEFSMSTQQQQQQDGLVALNDTGYVNTNGGYVMNVRSNDRYNGKKANIKNTIIRDVES